MSIVGPRPHAVAHNEQYRQLIKAYMVRHKVKPGITGWAQVNGQRGETDTVEKMQARVEYDLEYLRNWSLGLDLQIIVRTDPPACSSTAMRTEHTDRAAAAIGALDHEQDPASLSARAVVSRRALALRGPVGAQPSTPARRRRRATACRQQSVLHRCVSQAFSYDSNVFRVADGRRATPRTRARRRRCSAASTSRSDASGCYGNATVRDNNATRTVDQLDNNSYQLGGGLDWETIERLSGQRVSWSAGAEPRALRRRERVGDHRAQHRATTGVRRHVQCARRQSALHDRRHGSATARSTTRRTEYDLATSSTQHSVSARRSATGPRRTDGSASRCASTEGDIPAAVERPARVEPSIDRDEIVDFAWWADRPVLSHVNARLSATPAGACRSPARDFSGMTGAAALGLPRRPAS